MYNKTYYILQELGSYLNILWTGCVTVSADISECIYWWGGEGGEMGGKLGKYLNI